MSIFYKNERENTMKHTQNKIAPDTIMTIAPLCREIKFNLTGQARELAPVIAALTKINKLETHLRELSGVIGNSEHTSDYQTFFADVNDIRDLSGLKLGLERLALNTAELTGLALELNTLIDLHVPLNDKRVTPEKDKENKQKHLDLIAAGEQLTRDFLAEFSQGPDVQAMKVETGQQLITAQLCFNNSDSQSDYFHPHAHYRQALLLTVSKKSPRTEKRARAAIASYPIFNTVTKWEWDSDKACLYGYGSGVIREIDRYGHGTNKVDLHWCISFDSWGSAYPIKGYGTTPAPIKNTDTATPRTPTQQACSETAGKIIMTLNAEKQGVELTFPGKPSDEIRNELKQAGFRWSPFQKIWYAKQTPATLATAKQISGDDKPLDANGEDWHAPNIDLMLGA